jgi:xylulose-5-phosphate/fructose-6-phosphate phosphoketolase
MADARLAARLYTREHGEDDPRITDWTWRTDVTGDDGEIR